MKKRSGWKDSTTSATTSSRARNVSWRSRDFAHAAFPLPRRRIMSASTVTRDQQTNHNAPVIGRDVDEDQRRPIVANIMVASVDR